MSDSGSVIAVHPYPQYVDDSFRDIGAELSDDFPVYGVEASNYSEGDMVGDFYDDVLSEVENGRNGAISSGELDGLEPPFYFVGGLLHDCVPSAVESVMRQGYDAYIVEEGSFEKVDEGEFLSYDELFESERDFSSNLRNLYMLGVESVSIDDLI